LVLHGVLVTVIVKTLVVQRQSAASANGAPKVPRDSDRCRRAVAWVRWCLDERQRKRQWCRVRSCHRGTQTPQPTTPSVPTGC